MGQVLGGGEMGSGKSKNAFVYDCLFAFGRLVGDIGRFRFYLGLPTCFFGDLLRFSGVILVKICLWCF
jgi:hypothetical protein